MSSEWRTAEIGSIAKLRSGFPFKSEDWRENGVPVIKIANVKKGRIIADGCGFVSHEVARQAAEWFTRPGDVLIAMTGYVGEVAEVRPGERYLINQRVGRFDFLPNAEVYPRFFFYHLHNPETRAAIEGVARGSAQPNLSAGDAHKVRVSLPPLVTQRAIADFLGALDDRITLLRETNATLEAIAQALFKSWFVDFDPVRAKAEGRPPEGMDPATAALFPDTFEDSELGSIPKGWRVGKIGEIAEVIDCLHSKKPELTQTGLPFLQLSNIRDDGLLDTSQVSSVSEEDYRKWTSRLEASEGDCVITNVGRVGAVAQIPAGFKAAMGRNMTGIRLRPAFPYPTYLIELLLSAWMRAEIATKTDVGTILDALNVRNIPKLRCLIPPESVFHGFEEIARPLRASMEMNLARANSLAGLRDTLLPRLISGQLRLPEANAKIEEALA